MNKKVMLLCASIICLNQSSSVLAEEARELGNSEGSRDKVETGADSTREKRATGTEQSDRSYKDEEVLDAPPPPVRVGNQPVRPSPR